MNSEARSPLDSQRQFGRDSNRHCSAKQRLQSTIRAFENRLEDKIKSVFLEMMSQSKVQSIRLPAIEKQEHRSSIPSQHSLLDDTSFSRNNRSFKSNSYHLGRLSSSIRNSIDQEEPEITKPKQRAIGKKKYGRPKWVERKADILPKHIRNDPFCEPMPVSIGDINKGLFTLLNKGVISKDVDISTAFERGQPPMRTREAVLHHFEEKMVRDLGPEKVQVKEYRSQMPLLTNLNKQQERPSPLEGWALTGLDAESMPMKAQKIQPARQTTTVGMDLVKDLHIYHIQFRNFRVVQSDASYLELRKQEICYWGGIRTVIHEIEKFLERYQIRTMFADGKRILGASTSLRRINARGILDCLVGKQQDKMKLRSLKNIAPGEVKMKMCVIAINSAIRMSILRREYMKAQRRKQNEFKIVHWISSRLFKRRFQENVARKKLQNERLFEQQQAQFVEDYAHIKSEKHFEVHVPNCRYDITREELTQKLNVEITRIFSVRDPNLNVVYVCPFALTNDITNYYYKILELGEVTNYRDRITFVESDPRNFYRHRFENSKKLYYSTEPLRKIRQIVGSCPAYLVTSYPLEEDCMLALYLKMPLLSNYHIAQSLNLRESSILKFKELELPVIDSLRIEGNRSMSIAELVAKMSRFSQQTKCRKLIMKLNHTSCGTGLAIINMPINILDDLYNKTMAVNAVYYNDTKLFIQELLQRGGVVQKTELNFAPIVASVFISPARQYEVLGTFDKINNNFTNIGYSFPQQSIYHEYLLEPLDKLLVHLMEKGYYGYLDVNMYVDSQKNVYFERLQCHFTKLAGSLSYFRYLMNGRFENNGKYTTAITETISFDETGKTQPIEKLETRTYIYSPFIMHFGLSQTQMKNFFQLCRIEGVSFDLERKYGSTFILIDTLKSAIGLLTTGRNTRASVKLMTATLAFLIKQNQKIANDPTREKELRFRQKCNIVSVKSRYDELLALLKTEQEDADMP